MLDHKLSNSDIKNKKVMIQLQVIYTQGNTYSSSGFSSRVFNKSSSSSNNKYSEEISELG